MLLTRSIDAVITDLARPTCSVVHARDLRAAGISRSAVDHRITTGWLARILPRTYGVGPQCLSPTRDMLCMAGALSAGAGALIDGETAGELRGVWDRGEGAVHVSVPDRGRVCPPAPFVFHRARGMSLPVGCDQIGPIPITNFVDMCVRMSQSLTPWQLAYVIDRGVYRRMVELDELERSVARRSHCPWITVLGAALTLVRSRSAGTRSRSEDHALDGFLVAKAPIPIVNTRGSMGMSRDEPDFLWLPQRINLEVDGGHHDDDAQSADDFLRDAEAASRGFRVFRVRPRDVWRRRSRVVELIMRALDGEDVDVDPVTRRLRL